MTLTPQEKAHAESIADKEVLLSPIPSAVVPKLLIASVVRKPPVVLRAFLQTLRWQRFRRPTHVEYAFITDYAPADEGREEALALLKELTPHVIEKGNAGGDYSEKGNTHER